MGSAWAGENKGPKPHMGVEVRINGELIELDAWNGPEHMVSGLDVEEAETLVACLQRGIAILKGEGAPRG